MSTQIAIEAATDYILHTGSLTAANATVPAGPYAAVVLAYIEGFQAGFDAACEEMNND